MRGLMWLGGLACGMLSAAASAQSVQHASADVFGANPNTPAFTIAFPGSVVTGHVGIVVIRGSNATSATVFSVTDSLSTMYSAIVSDTTHDPYMWIYAGTFGSSGANTVTVVFSNSNTNYAWAEILEVPAIAAATAVTGHVATTGTFDEVCGALTTTTGAYFVMGAAVSGLVTYTAGTDSQSHVWTLINGSIGTSPNFYGGVQEYTSGPVTALTPHIVSSDNTATYTTVCAAFPSSASGATSGLSLLGVGRE